MNWVLFAACNLVSMLLGGTLHAAWVERQRYQRDAEHDARCDREHGGGKS